MSKRRERIGNGMLIWFDEVRGFMVNEVGFVEK